jgi:hypothetical protein
LGALHFVSGADGSLIELRYGLRVGQKPGLVLRNLGDVDDVPERTCSSRSAKNPIGSVINAGYFERSRAATHAAAVSEGGAKNDELGHTGDRAGSGGSSFLGRPARASTTTSRRGLAVAYAPERPRLFTQTPSSPERSARFGDAGCGDRRHHRRRYRTTTRSALRSTTSSSACEQASTGRRRAGNPQRTRRRRDLHAHGDAVNERLARSLAGGIELNETTSRTS